MTKEMQQLLEHRAFIEQLVQHKSNLKEIIAFFERKLQPFLSMQPRTK